MPDSSRRVAYVAHCLVNQNAKVSEFAKCAGVVAPLVERLRANGYEIQQLPCPEMSYLGVVRWWQSREQYDTPGYRRHCRALAPCGGRHLPLAIAPRQCRAAGRNADR